MSGILYVVATPIGNLDDLSPRAREVLRAVPLVAAEDTRHSGRLLSSIGAKPALMALHDHNEEHALDAVITALQSGKDVALVSDAGTPLVSDPGYRVVRAAHAAGLRVSPLPGPSAVTAALSVAGLPTDRFCFTGFLPAKTGARRKALEALATETRSIVLYESVHRIDDCLADIAAVLGEEREAFLGRELTKLHEQCVHANVAELLDRLQSGEITRKGEFVLVIAGAVTDDGVAIDSDRLLALLADKLSAKDAASIAAELTGEKKNALYERVLKLKNPA